MQQLIPVYKNHIIIFIICLFFTLITITNTAIALEFGEKMPVFTLKDIDGKNIKIEPGKKIISFIHYSSETCKELVLFLNKIEKKQQNENIIVVNLGPDNAAHLKRLANKYKIDFNILLDSNLEATKVCQVLKLPTTFLVNNAGNIQKIMVGFDQNIAEKVKSF